MCVFKVCLCNVCMNLKATSIFSGSIGHKNSSIFAINNFEDISEFQRYRCVNLFLDRIFRANTHNTKCNGYPVGMTPVTRLILSNFEGAFEPVWTNAIWRLSSLSSRKFRQRPEASIFPLASNTCYRNVFAIRAIFLKSLLFA